jgi:hypothetical protein
MNICAEQSPLLSRPQFGISCLLSGGALPIRSRPKS